MATRILGIDPSWSQTGLAYLEDGELVKAGAIATKSTMPAMTRLHTIAAEVVGWAGRFRPDVVAIEGYSFAAKAEREKMGELGGVLRLELYRAGFEFEVWPVLSWRKAVLGDAKGDKAQVVLRLAQRYAWPVEKVDTLEAVAIAYCAHLHRQDPSTWTAAQRAVFASRSKKNAA